MQLATLIAGPGITVSNATFTGSAVAMGSFTYSGGTIPFTSGVLLSTGRAADAANPGPFFASTDLGLGGDVRLTALAGFQTYDAGILEFDFVPQSPTISFNYIFASEEYPQWVGTGFNDVFAFYVSGPGFAGQVNIALVPGTGQPVTINTVNNGNTNSGPCMNCQYYIDNSNGNDIAYNGLTTSLAATSTSVIPIQPCQTYHLIMTIADGGDHIYDSGVFLQAGSLVSASSGVRLDSSFVNQPFGLGSTAFEGCHNVPVTFYISAPVATPTVIHFTVSGTATNGVDYNFIPDSVIIPAGQTSTVVTITPVNDGIADGTETVIFALQSTSCSTDSAKFFIRDVSPLTISMSNDTSFCTGSETLTATGAGGGDFYSYSWAPATGLSATTGATVTANPTTTTTYTATVTDQCGTIASGQVTVNVFPVPVANAGPDVSICIGSGTQLNATGGTIYSWLPVTGLTAANIANPIAVPTVSTTYTVTVSNASGCSSTDSMIVTINPLPVVNAGADVSICTGSSTQLNATGGFGYTWTPATGLNAANISNPVASPVVTTTYSVDVSDVNGCINTDSLIVHVNPLPIPNAGPDVNICINSGIQLNATGGTSYSWAPATGLSAANIANPMASPVTTTAYTVTVTDANSCVNTDTITVTVNPLPIANAGPDVSICLNANTTLNASGGVSYSWLPVAGLSSAVIPNPVASPATTTTYTVSVTDNNNCVNTDSMTVTVNPAPLANAGTDVAICIGNNTQLNASGGISYVWTPASGLSNANIPNPVAAPATTSTYTVTVTDANSCTATDAVIVTVNPLPLVNAGNNISICTGDSTRLSASGASSYVWTPAVALSNPNIANPVATPLATSTYTVTGTDANACVNSAHLVITVNPIPTADFVMPPGICVNQNVAATYQGVSGGTATFNWFFDGGTVVSGSGRGPYTVNWNTAGTKNSTLTVTDNGCVSPVFNQSTTVFPTPVSDAGIDTAFCSNGSVQIGSASIPGNTYLWSPVTGLDDPTLSNPNLTLPNLTAATVGYVYTVTTTSSNGCTSFDTVHINVYAIPISSFIPPAGQCLKGNHFDFVAGRTFGNAATFNWNFSADGTPFTSTLQNPDSIVFSTSGSKPVSLIITEHGCVSNTFIANVTVYPMPVAALSAVPDSGCVPLTVQFNDQSTANSASLTYTWNFGDAPMSHDQNPVHTYNVPDVYDVTLIVTTVEGCIDDTTYQGLIHTYPLPKAGFAPNPFHTSIFDPTITFQDHSTGASTCSYEIMGNIISNECNFTYTFPDTGDYVVKQVVTTIHGCLDSTSLLVRIDPDFAFYIPNTFTPDGDGINDVFYCQGTGVQDFEIAIYNRWGMQVFRSRSMDNGWDGTLNGEKLPEDTYVYVAIVTDVVWGSAHKYRGKITLLR